MSKHYLQQELLDLLSADSKVFEFLDSAALDGLWFWDLEDPEQEWMSPRFWQTFGIDPATKDHKASEWQDLIDPDDLAVALRNFDKHLADPAIPYDQIVRYKHSDGSTVWVRCRGTAIRDGVGKPIRMLGAHTDITDLMLAREELEQQLGSELVRQQELVDKAKKSAAEKAERLHELAAELGDLSKNQSRILEGMTSAILVINDNLTIKYANKSASDLFGYSHEEFASLPVGRLVPQADRMMHVGKMKQYLSSPEYRKMGGGRTVNGLHKEGRSIELEIALNPISFEGYQAVLVNAIDISERVRAQRKIEKTSNELQKKNQELDDFARIVAHDLRDPIGRVQTIAELIEHYQDSGDEARQREALQNLKATTRHSIELIEDLYNYACATSELLDEARFRDFAVGDLLDQAQENLSDRLAGAKITREGEDFLLRTIESLAVQVLQNILANAVKYGPQERLEIKIFHAVSPDALAINIEDNGPGIPAEQQEAVFEPFVQLNGGRPGSGIGLGLATTRKIMNALGGSVRCENAESGGARFCLEFPVSSGG